MKNRLGFVSNSSSSSFLLIGTSKQQLIKKILFSLGYSSDREYWEQREELCESEFDHGQYKQDELTLIWGEEEYPSYIGFSAQDKLLQNRTVEEIKIELSEYLTKLKVNHSLKDLELLFGQAN